MITLKLLLSLIPICIELFADKWLIDHGQKDLSWKTRVHFVVFISGLTVILIGWMNDFQDIQQNIVWNVTLRAVKMAALCTSWFMFFDLALNKLRGLPWNYQGSNTKVWDNLIKRITGNNEHAGFNDYAVLVGRFVVFVGLLIYGLW